MSQVTETGASLIVDDIKARLIGKSIKYVPPGTTDVEAIVVTVTGDADGKNVKIVNAEGTPVRLVGVRWSYLASLFNEQNPDDQIPVADPMADVVGKNASPTSKSSTGSAKPPRDPKESKPKSRSSSPDGFDPEKVVYYTTAAQKTVILNLQITDSESAAYLARKKLLDQWGGKTDINSIAHLSYEESMALAPYFNGVKGANSLVAKSEWIRNSYEDSLKTAEGEDNPSGPQPQTDPGVDESAQ